jgi:hypothetical protein
MAKAALFEKSKKDSEPKGMKEGSKKEEAMDRKEMRKSSIPSKLSAPAKTSRPAKVPMAVAKKKPAPARNKGASLPTAPDADGDY